jgi:hypothetical protein
LWAWYQEMKAVAVLASAGGPCSVWGWMIRSEGARKSVGLRGEETAPERLTPRSSAAQQYGNHDPSRGIRSTLDDQHRGPKRYIEA